MALYADAGNRDLRGELRAIGPQHTGLPAAIQKRPFAGREEAAVPLAQGGRDHQRCHLLADDLGPAVTECAFRGRVEFDDASLMIDRDDAVQRGFQDGPHPLSSTR